MSPPKPAVSVAAPPAVEQGGDAACWYAVHTKARNERLAVEHLERQGYRTHLPLIRAARHRRGRWQGTVEPLFPGYVFVRLDLRSDNSAPIRSTRGVIGLVRFGGEPLPVPHAFMRVLHAARGDANDPIDPDHLLRAGDRVTLVEGPMTGLMAIVEAKSGRDRVLLLLELLGRQNRISAARHQVAPVS